MRRKLIIAGITLVLLAVGVAVYFFFFSKPAVTVAPGVGLPTAGQGGPAVGGATGISIAPGAPVAVGSRLVKISAGPVSPGEAVVNVAGNTGTSSTSTAQRADGATVSYVERQSGNVYSYSSVSKTTTRTSNKTIPGVQSAAWHPNASFALVQYLSGDDSSTVNTYALPSTGVGGFFLPQNLADVRVSSTSILTLSSGVNGSVASLTNLDGSRPTQIFTTPLSAARVSFAGKDHYLVYTKPSSHLSGDAFLVDASGNFSRVSGPHDGLVALSSPSGKWVLVSYSFGGSLQTELVNTSTNETLPLPISTIADKCAWAADDSVIYCGVPTTLPVGAAYPDDWYQGALHFSDRLWKIQVSGRYAQLVLDFAAETKDSLDATDLAIDPLNTMLVFINKNDGSLWGYSL